MARPWRIQYPEAVYHVTARGNNRQRIFRDDQDRRAFLALLARAVERFQLHLFAFCLMDNHYHLFLRTPQANLAQAMHFLNAAYTQAFHRRHRGCGHLLSGRYRAVLVEDDSHWRHLSAYIHLNPVRAGLVSDPADHEWSSFREYTRARSRFSWLHPDEVLAAYGADAQDRRRRYGRAIIALAGRPPSFWEEIRQTVFFGAPERWRELTRERPPGGAAREVPLHRDASRPRPDFDRELARAAAVAGTTPDELTTCRQRNSSRPIVYYHLVEHCGFSVTHVAGILAVTPSAVSQSIRRLRRDALTNKTIAAKIKELNYNVTI